MERILIILFVLPSAYFHNTQNVHFDWVVNFSGTGSISKGSSIATDAARNVYTKRLFAGTVDFDPGPGTYFLTGIESAYGDMYDGAINCSR